ncbi:MAG: ankyrin repeat domain-containing protein [Xanthobacteraceae bacterium]
MRLVAIVVGVAVALVANGGIADESVLIAARRGDLAQVRALLAAGADPNIDRKTHSPLMFAAGNGHVEMTRLLIVRGARIEHRDHNGDRALLWAARRGHAETVRLLLAAGAVADSDDDPYGLTALMQASRYGHIEAVRLLLASRADLSRREQTDDTALHRAALTRNAELVALLLRAGADPRAVNKYLNETPLHAAVMYGTAETVRLIAGAGAALNARDHKGRTALWLAASLDRAGTVDALLAAGADPDARDAGGVTPFTAAVRKSGATAWLLLELTHDLDRGFAGAVWGGHPDLAMRLVERGADVNAVDDLGRPGLSGVVRHPGAAMLQWFLANGVDLGRHGGAALAQTASAGRLDLIEALIGAGVPVDARDAVGATGLLRAVGSGHVEAVRFLLVRGADRGPRDSQGRGVEEYMMFRPAMLMRRIKERSMSRAYKPTKHLQVELSDLTARHAEIRILLAR